MSFPTTYQTMTEVKQIIELCVHPFETDFDIYGIATELATWTGKGFELPEDPDTFWGCIEAHALDRFE